MVSGAGLSGIVVAVLSCHVTYLLTQMRVIADIYLSEVAILSAPWVPTTNGSPEIVGND